MASKPNIVCDLTQSIDFMLVNNMFKEKFGFVGDFRLLANLKDFPYSEKGKKIVLRIVFLKKTFYTSSYFLFNPL